LEKNERIRVGLINFLFFGTGPEQRSNGATEQRSNGATEHVRVPELSRDVSAPATRQGEVDSRVRRESPRNHNNNSTSAMPRAVWHNS